MIDTCIRCDNSPIKHKALCLEHYTAVSFDQILDELKSIEKNTRQKKNKNDPLAVLFPIFGLFILIMLVIS